MNKIVTYLLLRQANFYFFKALTARYDWSVASEQTHFGSPKQ